MLPNVDQVTRRPAGWSTAGILNPSDTRRFVGRLKAASIDYQTSSEGDYVRVTVPSADIEEAMSLRPDKERTSPQREREESSYPSRIRMLFSIPGGAICGTVIAHHLELESRFVPALCSVIVTVAVEVIASGISQRRVANGRS